MLLYYILKTWARCVIHHTDFKKTDPYKSWKMLKDFRKSKTCDECKSMIIIYLEANRLSKYWKCFPNVYFSFGMFRKEFDDMDTMESFIHQGAYARYAKDKDSKYHVLIDDKILFHNIMMMYDLPVPNRFFVFQDNTFRKNGRLITDNEVDAIIGGLTDDRIFIKRYNGGGASGISIAVRKSDGYYTKNEKKLSALMIRETFCDSNYIFEQQVVQEKVLRRFNPDTANTIRITTYNNKPVSASIRFGIKGSFVDNISAGGLGVSVDLETGELGEYGSRLFDTVKFFEHPSSGIRFSGTIIPGWKDIIELVERTLQYLPYYKSVGFDIVTTDNGPVIIEINTGCGMGIAQMGKKRGIADKFKENE